MTELSTHSTRIGMKDLTAGVVVFLVSMPLCIGIATASGAPAHTGIIAGIIGGIVVGLLSGSHTSIAGPAGGLIPIVAWQIQSLGSYPAFLLAVVVAGALQLAMGLARLGFLASFAPTSVIKGLMAAIGVIVVLKQIPHILGHDSDPEGEMAFFQVDQRNTFSELAAIFGDYHLGAAVIGLSCLAILMLWNSSGRLKRSGVPGSLVAILWGVLLSEVFARVGGSWAVTGNHLLSIPVPKTGEGLSAFLAFPDFSQWNNPAVYRAAVVIAVVASLETLLSLEVIDRLDPFKRESPTSRELMAQGVGNTLCGFVGGIPLSTVIIRSSINVSMGAQSRWAAVLQGVLLLVGLTAIPSGLNRIPMASIAAVLMVTGFRLASPRVIRRMFAEGREQFLPFMITVLAIVLTDVLTGLLIGLAISIGFVLRSNLMRPLPSIRERHPSGDVLRIELGNQVSFLNKAALERALLDIPRGGHVVIDGRQTDYIDPDVRNLIDDFRERTGPVRGVQVSVMGFDAAKHRLGEEIRYVDYVDRQVQDRMTPQRVYEILKEGNERFRTGSRLTRDFSRQAQATALGQHPLACILGCIDSRSPTELVFDAGLGDLFSVRIAGNVISRKVLGSIEYACSVGGARLVVVMGHTRCGAVTAAATLLSQSTSGELPPEAMNDHVHFIVEDIAPAVDLPTRTAIRTASPEEKQRLVDAVAERHVGLVIDQIRVESAVLRDLEEQGRIAIVGAMYDVRTGEVRFTSEISKTPPPASEPIDALAAATG